MKKLYKKILVLFAAMISAATLNAQTELVTDGGFEAGPGSGAWIETSTNFGTPLCDLAGCGTGTGTGPHAGSVYWAWFGGIPATTETGTVTQSFVIPTGGTVTLTFWLEQIICDSPQDFIIVTVDGDTVFTSDGSSALCGVLGYSQQTVDISSYADGNSHTLEFYSTTFSVNGGNSNFFVDDVSVISDQGGGGVSCADTTTFGGLNVAIPDDDPLGVTDSQTISGVPGTLGVDVQLRSVCFKVDHTWVGDVIVTLIAPNGTQVVLADRPGDPAIANGCDGDNIYVCIDEGTGNELENVCGAGVPSITGSYTAANGGDLSTINAAGGPANGTWQLFASDNAGLDTGAIIEWALAFDDGPVASWTSPGTVCASSGTINLDALVTGTTGGTWSGSGVTGSTFDPTGLNGPIAITYSVADTSGCSDDQTNNIIVDPSAPAAGFSFTTISLTGNFTNTSTGGGTYSWTFGDGVGTSTSANPSYTYSAAGTYDVTLTVTNACGSDSTTQSITITGCPDIIIDGGFEAGPGSGNWVETSTNFGTPLCDVPGCGLGGGTGPYNGSTYWAWFGGIAAFEEGTVSQDITIAINSTATLSFQLEMANCDGPDDFLKIAVDADTVFTIDGGSALCGVIGYSLQTVNLDVYDDGLPHTLTFISRVYGNNGGVTNFFVDDIALNVCPGIGFAENVLGQHINVMPIPARDYVNITFRDFVASDVKVEVTDMVGKTVLDKTIQNVFDDQVETINVASWNQGVYMIKVSSGTNSIIRKIVIQ